MGKINSRNKGASFEREIANLINRYFDEIGYDYKVKRNLEQYQEKDLGVIVTSNLDWKEQCSKVLSKANQKLGMSRRNCYFVKDLNRRRVRCSQRFDSKAHFKEP